MVDQPCPFCSYVEGRFPLALIVRADAETLVVPCLGQKPANRGHCLVLTRLHIPNLYGLQDALAGPLLRTVTAAARAVKAAFAADGVSIRQNNEAASGQDVFHLHFHVVPRFEGDQFDTSKYEKVDEPTRLAQADALRRAWAE